MRLSAGVRVPPIIWVLCPSYHLLLQYTGDGELVFSYRCLWGFFFPYFIMAFVTFGTAVPAGLFIPSLVSGAALGRVVGQAIYTRRSASGGTVRLSGGGQQWVEGIRGVAQQSPPACPA